MNNVILTLLQSTQEIKRLQYNFTNLTLISYMRVSGEYDESIGGVR